MGQIKTRDGRIYQDESRGKTSQLGTRIRISPQRPWRGKSERRQVIKQRREDKKDL